MIRGMRAGLNGARASYHWNSDLALGQQDRTSSGAACWGISAAIRRTVIESSHIGQIHSDCSLRPVFLGAGSEKCAIGVTCGPCGRIHGPPGGPTDPAGPSQVYWGLPSGAIHRPLGFWPMRNPAMQYHSLSVRRWYFSKIPPLWSLQYLKVGDYPGEPRYLGECPWHVLQR